MANPEKSPFIDEGSIHYLGSSMVDTGDRIFLLLSLSPELDRTVEELMERARLSKAEILNMSVGFLKAAADAIDQGKRVGISFENQKLEVEFTGL